MVAIGDCVIFAWVQYKFDMASQADMERHQMEQ